MRRVLWFGSLAALALVLATCSERRAPRATTPPHRTTVATPKPKAKPRPGHRAHSHGHGAHPHAIDAHHHHTHPHPHVDGQNGHHHPY